MAPKLNHDNSLAKKAFARIFFSHKTEELSCSKVYPAKLPDWGPNPLRKARLNLFNLEKERTEPDFRLYIGQEKRPVFCLYRRLFSYREIYYLSKRLESPCPQGWLFVLSQDRIFFDSIKEAIKRLGYIRPLDRKYADPEQISLYFKEN